MPIYEFQCEACGEEFEVLLKSRSEMGEVSCPKCQSSKTKRLMSAAAALIDSGQTGGDQPRVAESHRCPSGTCTHLELPGHAR